MILETNNLKKIYQGNGISTIALNDVSLTIDKGEFVSIMGPSGCGKSTILNIIGLLDDPTSGKIFFDGKDVTRLSKRKKAKLRREEIGFVFQSFNLIDELTLEENIELPLVYQKIDPAKRKEKVEEVMNRLHIAHKRNFYPHMISGGQQQRVAVARAVVTQPKLILADEPTGNLDSVRGQEVMDILAELNNQGTTILMVTHSSVASAYSSRIIHFYDGQVVSQNINDQKQNPAQA